MAGYKVVKEGDLAAFTKSVEAELKKGWSLVGGVQVVQALTSSGYITVTTHYQALTKTDS